MALLVAGAGELGAAIRAYRAAQTVRALFRLSLSAADFAVAYTDLACRSEDASLCEEWREISFYLQIGLLSANAADMLEGLIHRTQSLAAKGWPDELLSELENGLADPNLVAKLSENPELVEAWRVFKDKGLDALARNPNALKYLDDLKDGAKFGNDGITDFNQLKKKWDEMFPSTINTDGTSKLVRHHAVEQQVLTRYPGVVSDAEMQSIKNLRGIPKDVNSGVHLSKIRIEWNKFYRQFDETGTVPTKQQLLDKATEIDQMFGDLFNPPLK